MTSTTDYHYMQTSLTQSQCHNCLPDKNNGELLPTNLEFSSGMNLDNSNESTQGDRQCNHHHHHHQHPLMYQQPQQHQKLPAISHAVKNSSFRLPSFPSLIFGSPSHSVPRRNLSACPSPPHPYSNSLHLPSLDQLANRLPFMPSKSLPSISPTEHPLGQPVYGATPSAGGPPTTPSRSSFLVSMADDNNRASYAIQPLPVPPTTSGAILTTSAVNASPTPVTAKKGRQTRNSKFMSRILNSDMQWPNGTRKNSNDATSFRPYQYEHRRSSQPYKQQQQQQEGRRRRISSVGTASSLTSVHVSSSTTTTDSSPSLSTALSVVSTSSAPKIKPRWQGAERLDLLKAIVKEKQLDDMTSFSWDRISLAVGRGKKSCKDQWRREILPALLEKLK